MSDSLRPHESQHSRPPCPSPTPGVHSDSLNCIQLVKGAKLKELCTKWRVSVTERVKESLDREDGQGSMLQSMGSQRVECGWATELKRITGCQEFKVVVGEYWISVAQRIFYVIYLFIFILVFYFFNFKIFNSKGILKWQNYSAWYWKCGYTPLCILSKPSEL